jgi:hypothetical protein
MTEKKLNRILGVVFLIVGILAAVNTFRLNSYIRETVPRDAAQEQCNAKQIEVMKSWLEARANRDNAMDARDEATITALDQLLAGEKVGPEQLRAWRDAVVADRQIRLDVAGEFESHLLPAC